MKLSVPDPEDVEVYKYKIGLRKLHVHCEISPVLSSKVKAKRPPAFFIFVSSTIISSIVNVTSQNSFTDGRMRSMSDVVFLLH